MVGWLVGWYIFRRLQHTSFIPQVQESLHLYLHHRINAHHHTLITLTHIRILPMRISLPCCLTLPSHCYTILPTAPFPQDTTVTGAAWSGGKPGHISASRNVPVKPPRSEDDSQTTYIPSGSKYISTEIFRPDPDANP